MLIFQRSLHLFVLSTLTQSVESNIYWTLINRITIFSLKPGDKCIGNTGNNYTKSKLGDYDIMSVVVALVVTFKSGQVGIRYGDMLVGRCDVVVSGVS